MLDFGMARAVGLTQSEICPSPMTYFGIRQHLEASCLIHACGVSVCFLTCSVSPMHGRYSRGVADFIKLKLDSKHDPRGVLLLAKSVEQAIDRGQAKISCSGIDSCGNDVFKVGFSSVVDVPSVHRSSTPPTFSSMLWIRSCSKRGCS